MTNFAHPVFLLIFSFPLFANALTNTILQGQFVTASTAITSSRNEFELGFFSPGNKNSTRSSYLGVWYRRVSEPTVVWVANRDYPLTDSSAALTIAADGNLVIVVGRVSYMLSNISSSGNTSDMSGGCGRKAPLQCGNDSEVKGQKDQFLRVSKVRLPANSTVLSQVRSVGDCRSACFSNCSCSAYTYDGNGSNGCSIWHEELLNVVQLKDDDLEGRDFYLRLAASEFLSKGKGMGLVEERWGRAHKGSNIARYIFYKYAVEIRKYSIALRPRKHLSGVRGPDLQSNQKCDFSKSSRMYACVVFAVHVIHMLTYKAGNHEGTRIINLGHPVFLLIFSFSLFANALTDTISQGQLITASTTITSSGNKFELGFFAPGQENSATRSYLGVWYKRVSEKTVVWIANRDNPFTDSTAVLTIAAEGNLVILNGRMTYMLSIYVSNENESYYTCSMKNPSGTVRFVLDISGQLQVLTRDEMMGEWDMLWAQPWAQCDVYAYCGAFGTCNQRATPFCQCFPGFQPNSVGSWNAGNMSGGCVRKTLMATCLYAFQKSADQIPTTRVMVPEI
ncbi:hypothetical protein C3L33_13120, partial [Rhododendron williamsianum]